jgi:hypothetical protein
VSSANAQDWASSTQAWAEVATAAISLLAFAGLIITINLQRKQSAVEGNSRAKHDELVDRQLAQLLALQETAARRQADNVTVFWERKLTVPSLSGGPFLAARVENRTGRPIRDVRAGARSNPDERYAYTGVYQLCLSTGTPVDGPPTHDVVVYAMPDGFGYQFVSGIGHNGEQPPYQMAVRFRDDARVAWQVNSELDVTPFDPADWGDPLPSSILEKPIASIVENPVPMSPR